MHIYRHYSGLDAEARGSAVAIGNFDGLHPGHRAVIGRAGEIARESGAPHAVLTFEPHPREVFKPDIAPFRLTPFRSKARQIEAMGVDLLFALHFDMAFAQRTAEEFVAEVLADGLGACHVVVGDGFVFGNRRRGNPDLLRGRAEAHGFSVSVVEPVTDAASEVYSSTRVREFLIGGQPAEAARLLGRSWEIEGRVERGERRGVTIGFPTANLTLGEYLRPAVGVYAVRAAIVSESRMTAPADWRDGVANLGHRPTFGTGGLLLEVHLFDFDDDLYGKHLRVRLVEFLRPEKKFDGIDSLRAQIAEDGRRAREFLAARQADPADRPPATP